MIIDITGTVLTPGNWGRDCLGDGRHHDKDGNLIECCCDECGYLRCCTKKLKKRDCFDCWESECPRWHQGNATTTKVLL